MVFKVKEENSTDASGDVEYDCKYNDGQKLIGETGTWTASVKSEEESEDRSEDEEESEDRREEGLTKEAVTASYEYEDKLWFHICNNYGEL